MARKAARLRREANNARRRKASTYTGGGGSGGGGDGGGYSGGGGVGASGGSIPLRHNNSTGSMQYGMYGHGHHGVGVGNPSGTYIIVVIQSMIIYHSNVYNHYLFFLFNTENLI